MFHLQRTKSKTTSSKAAISEAVFIDLGILLRKWKIASIKDIVKKITFNIVNVHKMLRIMMYFLLSFGLIGQVHVNVPVSSRIWSTWRISILSMPILSNVSSKLEDTISESNNLSYGSVCGIGATVKIDSLIKHLSTIPLYVYCTQCIKFSWIKDSHLYDSIEIIVWFN